MTEAYDEQVTTTKTVTEEHLFANTDPSRDLTLEWQNDPQGMTFKEWLSYHYEETNGWHNGTVPVQKTVTETVHHDAVTEQYIDYYYCADDSCGATKEP